LPNDSSRTSTSARIFDPSGNPVSGQFQVNDFIESYQSKPKVTTLTDGSFVFLWENNHSGVDGNGRAVVAEHYNVDGTIRKSDFIANTSTLYNQWNPKITALHDGGYFTAYSNTPISGSSTLLGQRFDKNSEKIGSEITIHEPPHYHTDYYNLNDNGFIAIYKQSDGALISNSYFTKIETTASTVAGIDLTSGELSREALTRLDTALQTINSQRAELGSLSNRLDHIIANNTNASTNTKASLGRIQDADFAAETTKLAKSKILEQSSTAMLAQANASVYEVLTLIPD
jgi:flagellin-like hook-associated protein FlgL